MPDISVVVPCYNEAPVLDQFYDRITAVAAGMDASFEFLFINDGSRDDTLAVIKRLREKDARVRYVSFSRNFGKEAGIFAGLQNAAGSYVAVMDADLQDPPELLPEMYTILTQEDYDCVRTRRVDRKGEPPIRSAFARMFYKLINRISKAEIVDGARDFQLMKRKVVDAVLSLGEYNRFSKGIFGWVGFRTRWLEFENVERAAGETKWNFWSLFLYALDGIIAFSTAPLVLSSVLGMLLCVIAFFLILFIIVRTLIFGDPTSGWPSLVCIILMVSGIQLLCIGILGQYLSKTYLETKRRPLYLVSECETEHKSVH